MITAKSSFVEEKYTAQYYSGNSCLYVSGAGGVLKGGGHDLLVMGLGVSATVGLFESIVAQLPVIMSFQSLILDMAGNVGTQSLAVAIRVLMDKQTSGKQKLTLILKESRVGLTNGFILGISSFLVIGGYLVLKGNGLSFAFAVSGCLGAAMILAMCIH